MSWRVLITCPPMLKTLDNCRDRFIEESWDVTTPEVTQQLSEEELCKIIAEHDGVIAGDDFFTAKVLETGRRGNLKALAKWGIGIDAIDLEAAKSLGIYTSNTPDVFGEEVADITVGYTVMLARHLHIIDQAVRQGNWLKVRGMSLRDKSAGIIGVGSIGKAVAKRFQAMGIHLLGYDIVPLSDTFCRDVGLQQTNLSDLLAKSDIIIVACVLTADNRHMLNTEAFEKMKNGVLVLNVSRGPLIQETALIEALENEKVAGAALDVFESEPLSANNPLCSYPQVILGSHNGSNTEEAVLRVNQLAIDNLARDLKKAVSP